MLLFEKMKTILMGDGELFMMCSSKIVQK